MNRRANGFRIAVGMSAMLGLGLLLTAAAPASADRGHNRNSHRSHDHDRGRRWDSDLGRRLGNRDFDRDGTPDRRDWDIDGDRIPNRYDRNDYRDDRYRYGSSSRYGSGHCGTSRFPREYDYDRDGVRNKYDRFDYNPHRR